MALQDVLNKITFTGFDAAGEQTLTDSITELYNGSATARVTLDKVANDPTNLTIQFLANNANVPVVGGQPAYTVRIDDDFASDYRYIDQNGTSTAVTTTRVLMHEMIHAVEKLRDNYNTTDDFDGDTVALTNTIMAELGETSERISYTGVAGEDIMALGTNYSNGNVVDGAFVVRGGLDMSGNPADTSDVIFGANGSANQINGGGDADYIYGRDGNDTITGGAGNDYIDGGDDVDVAVFTGDCDDYTVTVTNGVYTITDDRAGSPDGTDTVTNVEYAQFADGTGLFNDTGIACPGQNVVLAIDVSGSMGDEIAAVQQSAQQIVESIFGTDQMPLNSRFAIITFNDTGALRTELQFTDQDSIAARKQAAIDAINQVSILGGGVEPLNGAVLSAAQGDAGPWLAGATANRVIVFSDEPAGDPGVRAAAVAAMNALNLTYEQPLTPSNANTPGSNFFEEVENTITPPTPTGSGSVYPVIVGGSSSAANDAQDLASQTGGQVIQAQSATEIVNALLQVTSTQVEFTGTDEGEEIVGNVNDNIIDALGGDDTVLPSGGVDMITLGDGADVVQGTLSDLNGDTITDFGVDDMLVIDNFTFDPSLGGVTYNEDNVVLSNDADSDGTPEFEMTLEGDFSGGDFLASQQGVDFYVSYETYLPELAEGQRVDAGAVNGINSSIFLTGDGTRTYDVDLKPADAGAAYNNALGVYEIDSAGNIVDVRILFENVKDGANTSAQVTGVENGNQVGFFVIQDGADFAAALAETDTLDFVTSVGAPANVENGEDALLSVNGTTANVTVFHSLNAEMNTDDAVHALSGILEDASGISIGFEDLLDTGDADYQDVLFEVTVSDLPL